MEPQTTGNGAGREIVRNVGRAALEVAGSAIGGVLLLVLMVIFLPLGLGLLIVAAALYYVVFFLLLGAQGGTLMGVVGAGYWLGTLVLMFVVFRKVYRWLARRTSTLGRATELAFGGEPDDATDPPEDLARVSASPSPPATTAMPPGTAPAPALSLAELDARLAPTEAPADPR